MFYDLAELEHVIEQLENDSKSPSNETLNWICSSKSEFNRRLTALIKAVYKRERNHGVMQGTTYQSGILSELDYRLLTCSTPSKLKAYLPELKDLLFKSMLISLDHRIDSLEKYSAARRNASENWLKFDNQQLNKKRRVSDELTNLLTEILKERGNNLSTKIIWKN